MKTIITAIIVVFLLSFSSAKAQHDPFQLAIDVHKADSVIKAHIGSDHPFNIIDLRTEAEFAGGYIEGARNLNYYLTGFDDSLAKLDKDREYLIYCASGGRSAGAFNKMKTLQFKMVYNMLGGTNAWRNAGYPLVTGGTGINIFEKYPLIVKVFPNPVTMDSKFVLLDGSGQNATVKVLNMTGQLIEQFELNPGDYKLISDMYLQDGLYFFQVFSNGNMVHSGKFLKTK